jgi:hypothetical protein
MAGNANSGGKTLNDRKLASEVRNLTLTKIKRILERPVVEMNGEDKRLHDEILLKLAGTVLPRLTEVTGSDGDPLFVTPEHKEKSKKAIDEILGAGNTGKGK